MEKISLTSHRWRLSNGLYTFTVILMFVSLRCAEQEPTKNYGVKPSYLHFTLSLKIKIKDLFKLLNTILQ